MRPKKLTGPPLRNSSMLNFEDAAASQSRLEISHRFAVGANKPSPCRVATMDRSGLLRAKRSRVDRLAFRACLRRKIRAKDHRGRLRSNNARSCPLPSGGGKGRGRIGYSRGATHCLKASIEKGLPATWRSSLSSRITAGFRCC
jgi:hypothetical protein